VHGLPARHPAGVVLGRLLPAIDLPVAQLNCDWRGWRRSCL
jgi:hypothetical protein